MIISLTTGKKMKMKHVFIQLLKTKNIFISHLASTIGKIVAGLKTYQDEPDLVIYTDDSKVGFGISDKVNPCARLWYNQGINIIYM